MDFFYPNFINDHWRIEGEVWHNDKNYFVDIKAKTFRLEEIVQFCEDKGLAFYDTSTAVKRLQDNASDKFLEVVESTNIPSLLSQIPQCRAIVTTGEKATETICKAMKIPTLPKVNTFVSIPETYNSCGENIILYRLPSSSRAYPLAFEKKAEAYRNMFDFVLKK